MATKKQKTRYTPPEYHIQVNSLIDIELEINTLFNAILKDYCSRFNTKVINERKDAKIMLSLILGSYNPKDFDGLCAFEHSIKINTIAIQARCMVLEGAEPHHYVLQHWLEILCHEFVHACQCLTQRTMKNIEYIPNNIESEDYYFDPDEIEARLLQSFYANKMAVEEVELMLNKIVNSYGGDEEDFEIEFQDLEYKNKR